MGDKDKKSEEDPRLKELKEKITIARSRRDTARRGLLELEPELRKAIHYSSLSTMGLVVVKEAVIGIGTSLIGIGFARTIQNSLRLARWAREGSAAAQFVLTHSQRIGSIAAEWLVNGAQGDLRGALIGSVAALPKNEFAGALLDVCLKAADAALVSAKDLESKLLEQEPPSAPKLGFIAKVIYGQQASFEVVWKQHYVYAVQNHVWSRCVEVNERLLEIFLDEVMYPEPLHPVPALQALEKAVMEHRTPDDNRSLEWMTGKVEAIVTDIRKHEMPIREPFPDEGPLARLASIFQFLDDGTRDKLITIFKAYGAQNGWGWNDGLYDWWSKKRRDEIRELLRNADHRLRTQRPPFMIEDE